MTMACSTISVSIIQMIKKIYKGTSLESFAWIEIPNTNENNAISELDDEQLAYLFCDIPGEAG